MCLEVRRGEFFGVVSWYRVPKTNASASARCLGLLLLMPAQRVCMDKPVDETPVLIEVSATRTAVFCWVAAIKIGRGGGGVPGCKYFFTFTHYHFESAACIPLQ
jgi:hypothetical protein